MGLKTTHGCWNGPYESFDMWRKELHIYTGDISKTLEKAWEDGDYDDQTVPINVLMNHSDCEGEIPVEMCQPLANALKEILEKIPRRAVYDSAVPATERFISGLELAASKGEPVKFH